MPMIISVYKSPMGDCTLGGVSSKDNNLLVMNVDGPFENQPYPKVILQSHVKGCLRLVPAVQDESGDWVAEKKWYMAGGNFGATSDSRFSEKCEELLGHRFYGAVAIHDRWESS